MSSTPPPPDLLSPPDLGAPDYLSPLFTDSQLPEDTEPDEKWVLDTLSPWDLGTQVEETEMEDDVDSEHDISVDEVDWDLPENKDSFDVLCIFVPAYRQVSPIWKRKELERKEKKIKIKKDMIVKKKKERLKEMMKDDDMKAKKIGG